MFVKQLPALGISLALIFILAACNSISTLPAATAAQSAQTPATALPSATEPQSMVAITPTSDSGMAATTRVLWTVKQYILGANATVDENTAKSYLFKPLDIGPDYITFDGNTCQNVTFNKQTVATDQFLTDSLKTTQQTLGIDFAQIEVDQTNCTLPGFAEFMRLPDRRLIVSIDGVFYFFAPKVNQ
jgi:hypothetical protein